MASGRRAGALARGIPLLDVLVTMVHNKLSPNYHHKYKMKYLSSHTVSVGQGTGDSLAGKWWLGIVYEAAVQMSAGAAVT